MKVILLDYVYKQGVAGEVIDVADGYARNFLIPKGLAVKATAGELKRASNLREQSVAKRAALENRLNELARMIDGKELIFARRAAVTGKLFGSVTTQEIAEELHKHSGVDINRRRISQQPLREVGTHDVPVRLGTEESPTLKITIVREEELAEFLAAREAAAPGETVEETAAAMEAAEAPPAVEEVAEAEEETHDPLSTTEILPRSAAAEAVEADAVENESTDTQTTDD